MIAHLRLVLVAALTLCVAGVAAAAIAAGGDSPDRGAGPLRWTGKVTGFRHPTIKTDRVLAGRIRNDSLRRVTLQAGKDVRVVDANGNDLFSSAIFTQTFGRSMFDPTRVPRAYLPARELIRIGAVADMAPGASVPLTLSWREQPGGPRAARIEYRGGSLPLR